jgi:hypothetical protein
MVNEDTENALKVAEGDDQEPIEALSASGADEALGDRVGLRRAYGLLRPRCLACEDGVEVAAELAVTVAAQETQRRRTLSDCPSELAGLLGDPKAP